MEQVNQGSLTSSNHTGRTFKDRVRLRHRINPTSKIFNSYGDNFYAALMSKLQVECICGTRAQTGYSVG